MLKKFSLYALCLCAFAIGSCEKENQISPSSENIPEKTKSADGEYSVARLGSEDAIIDMPPTYKGLYIDGANNIIGNTTKENNLITYAVNKGINSFSFYGLKSVISNPSNYSKMASFLRRCYQNGITNFVYVVVYYPGSINGSDTTYIRKYNYSRALTSEKFTGVNLEWEFWNGATTWTTYLATLKTYYNWSRAISPDLSNEIYFGWFNNPSNIPQTMANEMVKYCDRILLHDYRQSPDVAYMKSRMGYLGQAAVNQGKIKKIVVLFSAEADFMGPYYSSHSFHEAYLDIADQYENTSFTGQSGLRIYGWQIYNYTHAKLHRP